MPWQPKPDAPPTFSLKNAMAAMLAGTEANWLTDWMFWIPDQLYSTADFCAAGPPEPSDQINLLDLLSAATAKRSPVAWGIFAASIGPKLQGIANERVFAAYCEQPAPAGDTPLTCAQMGTMVGVSTGNGGTASVTPATLAVPPGADHVRITWTGGDRFDDYGLRLNLRRPSDNNPIAIVTLHPGVPLALPWDPAINPAVTFYFDFVGWSSTVDLLFEHCVGQPTFIVPTPQPEPPNLPSPVVHRTYDDFQDLGDELDRQEAKLDMVLAALRYISTFLTNPTGHVGAPVTVNIGDQVDVTDAVACKVTIANVPAAVSELFEQPTFFRNLGHLTIWTADGPLAPLEIQHNPQVFMLPATADHVTVNPMLPGAATVELLYPTK